MDFSSDGLRKRRKSQPLNMLRSALSSTSSKFNRLSLRTKCVLIFCGFMLIVFYILMAMHQVSNRLREDSYLETNKCPACYGASLCKPLYDGKAHFTGLSNIRSLDILNFKNFHYGKYRGEDVVLKKLVQNSVLQDIDERICFSADRKVGCDVARISYIADFSREIRTTDLQVSHLTGVSDMFRCPSVRFVRRLLANYKERAKHEVPIYYITDKIQVLVTAMINSEPLMLQTFPSSEGWPFPAYIGACGRFIVVENCGQSLKDFYNAPIEKRADIAYQVLKIAEILTDNPHGYAIYWTELKANDFVVDKYGQVKFVDLNNVVVVDRESFVNENKNDFMETYEAKFLIYDEVVPPTPYKELCGHARSDWNIYMTCRYILSGSAIDPVIPGGLLHDMSKAARDDWDMDYLLKECNSPSTV